MGLVYPVKIEFKDYPSGSWQDWSEYLVNFPSTNQRVESENDGEAGIIVFDNASVTFRYEIDNPVYDAFSIDLTDKQRYVFRISYLKTDKTYVQRMEGIADFSTIEWPENEQNIISFDIIDKLSALGVLSSVSSRVEHCFEDRILAQQPGAYTCVWNIMSLPGNEVVLQVMNGGYFQLNLTEPLIHPGELIPDPRNILKPDFDKTYYAVLTSSIVSGYNYMTVLPTTVPLEEGEDTFEFLIGSGNNKYLAKELYGVDINNIVDDELINLKGIEVIRALYNQAWPGETMTLVPSNLDFAIPSEYAVLLTDVNPLGDTPLAALNTILNSIKPGEELMTGCYFYINKSGNPVIHAKSGLDAGTSRSLGSTKVIRRRKKYFWDKLIDAAEVTVKSWVTDEDGEYLKSDQTRTKEVYPGSGTFISNPKNKISRELLVNDSSVNTQEELDLYAVSEADDLLDFYGLRRSAYQLEIKLDDNSIEWELVDNIALNGILYFFTALEVDPVVRTVNLEAIEIVGHNYDFRQVNIPLSENSSGSTSGSGGSSSAGYVITQTNANYNFQSPLKVDGSSVTIQNHFQEETNILALRNGNDAQEIRIYNNYTNDSNNEFVSIGLKKHNNVFTIQVEANGGGIIRDIALLGGKVGINIIDPEEKLSVSGNIHLSGDSDKLLIGINKDTNLYRGGENILKTDDAFDAVSLKIGGTEVITSGRIFDAVSLKIGGTEVITNARVLQNVTGPVLPAGGTTGQILKKTNNNNYAVSWADEAFGSGNTDTYELSPSDKPPDSVDPKNDEFNTILNTSTKWTWINRGDTSAEIVGKRLFMKPAFSSGSNFRILSQIAPEGDFTITCKAHLVSPAINYVHAGLTLIGGTGNLLFYSLHAGGIYLHRYNSPQDYLNNSNILSFPQLIQDYSTMPYYLKLSVKRSTNEIEFYISLDGYNWMIKHTELISNHIGSITNIGVHINHQGETSNYVMGVYHWFRVNWTPDY